MNENKEYYQNDEIDLVEVFLTLWNKKFLIITITSIAAILSVLYALSLPNIYTSKASLVPSAPEDSLQSRIGALSSFGAFAGIDMPASKASKSQEAIERIQSFEFFSTYFLPNIKLENIMAVEKWLGEENLVYDKSLFDKKNNVWTKDNKGISNIPSEQEAYKVYRSILAINDDIKTSFVTISIDHKSPIIAQNWVTIIIDQINESMRKADAEEAQQYIDYLNQTAQSENIKSLKDVFTNLLEDQMQVLMLTASNDAYVFKTIDSPIVPEQKSAPSRAIISILGTALGLMLSLLVVFIQKYRNSSNS